MTVRESPILLPMARAIVVFPEQVPPPIRMRWALVTSDCVESIPLLSDTGLCYRLTAGKLRAYLQLIAVQSGIQVIKKLEYFISAGNIKHHLGFVLNPYQTDISPGL